MAKYTTMASMMGGGNAQAPIPTQTFNAANILGTPVPMVGDNKGNPNYQGAVGGVDPRHIVIVAVALFAIGYVVYHVNFEK